MNENIGAFNDEYHACLFDRLDKRGKTFMSLFRGTFLFAFAFLAFILIPLVGLMHDEHKYNSAINKQAADKNESKQMQQDIGALEMQIGSLAATLKASKADADVKEKEVEQINLRLSQIQFQIDRNTVQTRKFEADAGQMATILDRFQNLPSYNSQRNVEKLRESLLRLESFFDRSAGLENVDPCASGDMNRFIQCKVKTIIQDDVKAYQAIINDADRLLAGYVDLDGKKQIEARIQQVWLSLDRLMQKHPQFWRTIRGKIFFFDEFETPMQEVFREVDNQIQRYAEALDHQKQQIVADKIRLIEEGDRLETDLVAKQELHGIIHGEIGKLDRKINALKADHSSLNEKLIATQVRMTALNAEIDEMQGFINQIVNAKEDIEKRLQKIQSPFGTLPVGLSEAVLVFPVALAAMVILYSFVLADMMRLRMAYHDATIARYPPDIEKISNSIHIMAPIWLDPMHDRSVRDWQHSMMLMLPVVAYMFALLLILYSWNLEPSPPGSIPYIRGVYLTLYALGLCGFVIGGGRIYRAWSNYKTRREIGFNPEP